MAGGADDQGLAPPLCHGLHPFELRLTGPVERREVADLVHLHRRRLFAELAPSRLEPTDQLAAAGGVPDWLAVNEDSVLLPSDLDR